MKKVLATVLIVIFFIPWVTLMLLGILSGLLSHGFLYGYYEYQAALPNLKQNESKST